MMTLAPYYGEASFPTMPTNVCGRAGCACKGRVYGHAMPPAWPWDLAAGWAWRCADTLPDSAQGRRDSLADAETLLPMLPSWATILKDGPWEAVLVKPWPEVRWFVIVAARAAFRACPGLRGGMVTPLLVRIAKLEAAEWGTLAAAYMVNRPLREQTCYDLARRAAGHARVWLEWDAKQKEGRA